MKTISKLALCAPVLFALSACGGAEEAEVAETEMAVPVEEPIADPAMDPMATDEGMMAEDPMAGDDAMMGDPAATDAPVVEETPAEGM